MLDFLLWSIQFLCNFVWMRAIHIPLPIVTNTIGELNRRLARALRVTISTAD